MEYTILLLTQNLDKLERAYTVFVQNGSVKKNSNVAITNVKLRKELKKAIEVLQASTDKSKLLLADVSNSEAVVCGTCSKYGTCKIMVERKTPACRFYTKTN
jgi:hypothetical protein